MLHWLAHLTRQNTGNIVSWRDEKGIYVAFQCSTCKKIDQETVNFISYKDFEEQNGIKQGTIANLGATG